MSASQVFRLIHRVHPSLTKAQKVELAGRLSRRLCLPAVVVTLTAGDIRQAEVALQSLGQRAAVAEVAAAWASRPSSHGASARFKPFQIAGATVHQVGLPWSFGWATTKEHDVMANGKPYSNHTYGDSSNLLTPSIGDANTMIPETKAFMVNVEKK